MNENKDEMAQDFFLFFLQEKGIFKSCGNPQSLLCKDTSPSHTWAKMASFITVLVILVTFVIFSFLETLQQSASSNLSASLSNGREYTLQSVFGAVHLKLFLMINSLEETIYFCFYI